MIQHLIKVSSLKKILDSSMLLNPLMLFLQMHIMRSGNVDDINLQRPVIWCKQTEDVIINGERVAKESFDQYKANVCQEINVIQTVGGSTTVYVESVLPLFNQQNEQSFSCIPRRHLCLLLRTQE